MLVQYRVYDGKSCLGGKPDVRCILQGILKAKGFEHAVEDILIPKHPQWKDDFEIEVFTEKNQTGWWYTVGNWRKI